MGRKGAKFGGGAKIGGSNPTSFGFEPVNKNELEEEKSEPPVLTKVGYCNTITKMFKNAEKNEKNKPLKRQLPPTHPANISEDKVTSKRKKVETEPEPEIPLSDKTMKNGENRISALDKYKYSSKSNNAEDLPLGFVTESKKSKSPSKKATSMGISNTDN